MKKKLFAFVFLIIINLSLLSALDVTLTKSSYYMGETLQAEFQDAFISPLVLENIGIYREGAVHKTPAQSGLVKIDNIYHYYAILPFAVGKYSLKINAKHYEGAIESEAEIIKNFTITSTNATYLAINPGAVSALADFKITVKSYGGIQNVEVSFPEADFKQTQSIGYNQEKIYYISIAKLKNITKSTIKVGTYSVPVIISPPYTPKENKTNVTKEEIELEDVLEFSPNEINATILEDYDYTFELIINNLGDKTLKDIHITTSDKAITISPENFDLYAKKTIEVTINTDEDIKGFLKLNYKNQSIKIPINILVTKNESAVEYNIVPENEKLTCNQAGGSKCEEEETCKDGKYKIFIDGPCCMTECIKEAKSSAWIWGILILAVLGIIGWLLYQKYQAGGAFREKVDSIFKKRVEEYKERVHPSASEEVRKSLTKI